MNTITNEKLAFNVSDAAEMIGVSKTGLWRLIRSHQIPTVHIGKRRIVIRKADLESFLEKNMNSADKTRAKAKSVLKQYRQSQSI